MFDAMDIVNDEGAGTSDGFGVNMIFGKQEGAPLFHNAEVAPPKVSDTLAPSGSQETESQMSVLTLSPGEELVHCNK